MKTVFNFKKLIASTAVIAAAMSVSLSAEAGLFSSAKIELANEVSNNNYYIVTDGTPDYNSYGNLTDTGDYFREFSGVDLNGDSATTSFSARAYSQAAYGTLKTYATAILTNPIDPSANNNPFVVDTSFTINQNGMPTRYGATANASFSDTLTISSSASVSSIRLQLAISGEVDSGDTRPYTAYAAVYQSGSSTNLFDANANQIVNQNIWSNLISVVGNQASFELALASELIFYTWFLPEGGIYSATSDFFHTLGVSSIAGYDANGQQVNLTSAIGASGTHYTVAAPVNPGTSIPEPATLTLLGIGLAGMGWARRWRS